MASDERNSVARIFSRSVHAGAMPETRQSAPHECWTERVSSVAKRCFRTATVGTRSAGFRELAKSGFYNDHRVRRTLREVIEELNKEAAWLEDATGWTLTWTG
jgi:hypothetical protein